MSQTTTQQPPTHPNLIEVKRGTGSFSSYGVSLVDLEAGALFAKIDTATPTPKPAYSSVQTGKDSHIELNSDLLYCNHSCDPNIVFDMSRMEVRVVDGKPLKKGESLTFFYPSTEWDMAQSFECACGSKNCLGMIDGAKNMKRADLEKYWLNPHIEDMLKEDARRA